VAIRLTKGIGNEIKERRGEMNREVKEISNVISWTSRFHFSKQVMVKSIISLVGQCSKMLR